MKKAVAYYRVSRDRQGISHLGLDAQIKAIGDFAKSNGYTLEKEYVDIISGKKNSRSELKKALSQCRRKCMALLTAKIDRMGRRVSFISNLMESGIDFKVVEVPSGDKFTMHILAAVAEKEGDDISERTHLALQAAKARGTELGKYGRYVLSKKNKELSRLFAEKMKPTLINLADKGFKTIRSITAELNRLKIPTYRHDGSKWHVSSVYKIVKFNNQKS